MLPNWPHARRQAVMTSQRVRECFTKLRKFGLTAD